MEAEDGSSPQQTAKQTPSPNKTSSSTSSSYPSPSRGKGKGTGDGRGSGPPPPGGNDDDDEEEEEDEAAREDASQWRRGDGSERMARRNRSNGAIPKTRRTIIVGAASWNSPDHKARHTRPDWLEVFFF